MNDGTRSVMEYIEEWRDVVGHEGLYQVSNLGRVRSIHGKQGYSIGLVLKPAKDRGYHRVRLYRDQSSRWRGVHILVMSAFVGPTPNGHEINHKNGIRSDNVLGNLEYLTHSANMMHSIHVTHTYKSNYKTFRGQNHVAAKFKDSDISVIRSTPFVDTRRVMRELAARFNCTEQAIYLIITRRSWKHLP